MDRSLIADLTKSLFAAKDSSESSLEQVMESLALLGSLEDVTKQSLAPVLPAPAASETPPASSAPRPEAPSRTPTPADPQAAPRYSSTRREYQAALHNENLVEALIEFHRQAQAKRGSKGNILHSGAPDASSSREGFKTFQPPRVEAELKGGPSFKKGPGIAQPVLRSRPK